MQFIKQTIQSSNQRVPWDISEDMVNWCMTAERLSALLTHSLQP